MGTLVWTTPSALKFQINRVDIQPINKDTRSFFERNTDYMGGAGFVDLELAGAGADVFTADGTSQHLSVYEGLLDVKAAGVTARMLAWHERDVIAIEIDDRRSAPEPIQINLRMLRSASQYFGGAMEKMLADRIVTVRTREHTARSQISARDGRILLTQDFEEGTHRAKSAVAIALLGRRTLTRFANETEVRIVSPAERGRVVILIASAASLNADQDVAAAALRNLDAAAAKSFDDLAGDNAEWWHDFWQRGTIALHSADGVADYVGENYHYYLYLMAATSRGAFPPKFNGMLWNTAGDLRPWGTQHWFANLSCYYEALFAANRIDLLDPVFSMYSGMYDSACGRRAPAMGQRRHLHSRDGLARRAWRIARRHRRGDARSVSAAQAVGAAQRRDSSNTRAPAILTRAVGTGGATAAGPTARGCPPSARQRRSVRSITFSARRRRSRISTGAATSTRRIFRGCAIAAYPMIKGAAEFYRHFPNMRKEADGKYHIHHVNSNESVWARRTPTRICLRCAASSRRRYERASCSARTPRFARSGRKCSRIWRRCRQARTLMRCARPTTPAPLFSCAG